MLLIDGVKYQLWEPKSEDEFEQVVKEHTQEIFGEKSIYLDRKQRLKSLSGIGAIPDGYAILYGDQPQWHIVEVELSSHDLYGHIVPQVTKFSTGINNLSTQRDLVNAMNYDITKDEFSKLKLTKAIGAGEIYKFLSDLISQPPILTVIIEKSTRELEDVKKTLSFLQIKVVEFQTFTREGIGLPVHAHLFQPLHKPVSPPPPPPPPPPPNGEKVTVKDLIDARIVKVGQGIHKSYKGQRFEGRILDDGSIELIHNGKRFSSLSMAATDITGININGWIWWHTTKENGGECTMDDLRKEHR